MVRNIDNGITLQDIAQEMIDPRTIAFDLRGGVPAREGEDIVHVTEDGNLVSGHVGRREYQEYQGHKPSDDWYAGFDSEVVESDELREELNSGRVIGECTASGVLIHTHHGPERFKNEPCPVCGATNDCSDEANGGDN